MQPAVPNKRQKRTLRSKIKRKWKAQAMIMALPLQGNTKAGKCDGEEGFVIIEG